jgi:hypothetical protein
MKKITTLCLLLVASFTAFANADLDKVKALFELREDITKIDEAIVLCDSILAKGSNDEVAILLAKMCYFKGGTLAEKSEKIPYYLKGVAAGESVLNKIEAYKKAIDEKEGDVAMKALSAANMDALYWTAANLARYAKFTSFSKKLKVKNRVRYLWDRALELDPSYNYGGSYRFFGAYFALVPSITGDQDPVKSKEMFVKAIAASPEYLDSKVLYADAYCTHQQIKDKALFKKLLQEVIDADITGNKAIMPENKSAQEEAKRLLANEVELFED